MKCKKTSFAMALILFITLTLPLSAPGTAQNTGAESSSPALAFTLPNSITALSHYTLATYQGRPYFLLTFDFTSSEAAYFFTTVAITLTQNGVPLEPANAFPEVDIKKIIKVAPGQKATVPMAYPLQNNTDDITLTLNDWMAPTNSSALTATFALSDGTATLIDLMENRSPWGEPLPPRENSSFFTSPALAFTLANSITALSHYTLATHQGRPYFLLTFDFTSSEAAYFFTTVAITLTQNGVPLEPADTFPGVDIKKIIKVAPGQKVTVHMAHPLQNNTDNIILTLNDWMAPTSSNTLTATFTLSDGVASLVPLSLFDPSYALSPQQELLVMANQYIDLLKAYAVAPITPLF